MKWWILKKDSKRTIWTCRGKDHLGVVRSVAGFADKGLSEDLAEKIGKLVERRILREPLPVPLASWVASLAPRIRDRLAKIGLLDVGTQPLEEHLAAFEADLRGRGNVEQHVKATMLRIRRILVNTLKAKHWQEVEPDRVMAAVTALKHGNRPMTPGTKNDHLRDIKSFARWCVQNGRIAKSPLEHLRPLEAGKVRAGHRHKRRPFTVKEATKLLTTTTNGPEHHGMTGKERALLYQLGIETALRGKELRSLRRQNFDLDSDEQTVTIRCAYTKNREEATLPLRPDTAAMLKAHLKNRLPAAPAFNMPRREELSRMLKEDLDTAKIPYRDESSRVLNFHSLRHTTGSWLAAAGVHPKTIQQILRHSTITLTMDTYTHPFRVDEAAAINALPTLTPDAGTLAATGTTDEVEDISTPDEPVRGRERGSTSWIPLDEDGQSPSSSGESSHDETTTETPVKQAETPKRPGKKGRMRGPGLEPGLPREQDPKSCASSSSAILAGVPE